MYMLTRDPRSRQLWSVWLRVPCGYEVSAMRKFALLRYLSEFRLLVSSF